MIQWMQQDEVFWSVNETERLAVNGLAGKSGDTTAVSASGIGSEQAFDEDFSFQGMADSNKPRPHLTEVYAPANWLMQPHLPAPFPSESHSVVQYSSQEAVSVIGNVPSNHKFGSSTDHILFFVEGDNWLIGGAGNDYLHGGVASDLVQGGEGDDLMWGAAGDDYLFGHQGNDQLDGGEGHDVLVGGAGDDRMEGKAGNDVLHGDDGHDLMWGGDGRDYAYGGEGNDQLDGGADDDVLLGGTGDDRMEGKSGHDQLYGNEGVDLLWGGAGNDLMRGDDDDDQLDGGHGDDVLIGGAGADRLWGGEGADSFVFGDTLANADADWVLDFTVGVDRIGITALLAADTLGDRIDAGVFAFGNQATTSQQRILFDQNNGQLYYDIDGVGGRDAVYLATVSGNHLDQLDHSSFYIAQVV